MSEGVLFSRLLKGFVGGPCLRMLGERSTVKIYCLVSLLSVLNKVFEKLANNRIADHVQKCGLFSDF